MDKQLTVIVPAYNVENYLEKALDSCIIKNMESLEVLVVNDGSTDGTYEIAKRYEKIYPTCFKAINKENGGYGSVLNYGIEHASGRYLKVLDGDDWFNSCALASFIEKAPSISSDIVGFSYAEINDMSNAFIIKRDLPIDAEGEYKAAAVLGKSASMHSFIYKTELVRNCQINFPEHCLYTDTILVTAVLDVSDTVYIFPQDLYQYRVGREGQSVDPRVRARKLNDMHKVLTYLMSFLDFNSSHNDFAWRQCLAKFDIQYKEIYRLLNGDREMIRQLNQIASTNAAFVKTLAKTSRVAWASLACNGLFSPIVARMKGFM